MEYILSPIHEYFLFLSDPISSLLAIKNVDFGGVIALLLFILMAAGSMGPFLAFIAESKYFSSGKAFYEKCAYQITQATLVINLFALIGLTITLFAIDTSFALLSPLKQIGSIQTVESLDSLQTISPPHLLFLLALPCFTAICLAISLFFWAKKKVNKVSRLFMLLPSVILGFAALIWYFPSFLMTGMETPLILYDSFNTAKQIFAYILSYEMTTFSFIWACIMGIASAALASAIWLILRRNKADFGRDYYSFALRFCSKVASITLLVSTLAVLPQGISVLSQLFFVTPESIESQIIAYAALAVFLFTVFLLPLLIFAILRRVYTSTTPMRHKVSIFLALLLIVPVVFLHGKTFLQ